MYEAEKAEAQFVIRRGNLPHKIRHGQPLKLKAALSSFLRKEGLQAGLSVDPDEDGVWIYKQL